MTPVTDRGFGILIAYLLPGFASLALWGSGLPVIRAWLSYQPDAAPTVGGFLYVTLASLAMGLVLSTLRWAAVDPFHHRTGVRPPRWDYAQSGGNVEAYLTTVDLHYRYYQFYGSSAIVLLLAAATSPPGLAALGLASPGGRVLLAAVAVLFLVGSRDALEKYYRRASVGVGAIASLQAERSRIMTNGGHGEGRASSPQATTAEQRGRTTDDRHAVDATALQPTGKEAGSGQEAAETATK